MKTNPILFSGLLLALFVGSELPVVAAPPKSSQWTLIPELSDEFNDSRLNNSKWQDHNPQWPGRPPTFFAPQAVSLKSGNLVISAFDSAKSKKLTLPKEFTHAAGYVSSLKTQLYGYFEIRAKLMNSTQVSCFWLYNDTPTWWTEIDIVEVPAGLEKFRNVLKPNVHVFRDSKLQGTIDNHFSDQSFWNAPAPLADDFHLYGCEWTPDYIRWYFDGKMYRETPNTRWHQPLFIVLNIEANEWLEALPDDKHLPGEFLVDWIRIWRPASP